jgi:hypothetical protein
MYTSVRRIIVVTVCEQMKETERIAIYIHTAEQSRAQQSRAE